MALTQFLPDHAGSLLAAFLLGGIAVGIVFSLRLQAVRRRAAALDHELAHAQAAREHTQLRLDELRQDREDFQQVRTALNNEFRQMAGQVLDDKGKHFAATSQTSLEATLRPFREQIEAFQKRVNDIHAEALRENVALGTEIRRVSAMGLQIGEQADSLATALRGENKTLGNWGEVLLERCLQSAGLVRGEHYDSQPVFHDGQGQRQQPDFVIYLPDDRRIVLDSKVSLVDYDRSVSAEHENDAVAALDAHVRSVRQHIDDLDRKNYAALAGSRGPGFVLMYMPVEAAAIAAVRHRPDMIDYAWRKQVMLVSHSTLLPVLKIVADSWVTSRTHEQAQELARHAGDVWTQLLRVAERLKRLGVTLGTASRHYNDTVTAMAGQQGLAGKASRFAAMAAQGNQAPLELDELTADFQAERLDASQFRENPEYGPSYPATSSK